MQSTNIVGLLILRLSLAAVFAWFGISQVSNPQAWISWVPLWAPDVTRLSEVQIVLFNGGFETVAAALLLLGLWTRIVAFLLALHVYGLAFSIGLNDIGVRDFGIASASLALAFFRPDRFTLDSKLK